MAKLPSMVTPGLLARLAMAESVLIAGAGGGFDVFAGLPLALSLMAQGKRVHFANLTFTYLGGTDAQWLVPHLAVVTAETSGERYFPERALAQWLASQGLEGVVYALEKVGVVPARAAYEYLSARLGIDAIVLVDGGTDILMRGDEAGLGTPEEDMTSLAAVAKLAVPTKLVACIGFGIDSHHGVCHAHFLENVAALDIDGGYLGAFSVPRTSDEGRSFLEAVSFAHTLMPDRMSIVNGSIAAAIRGDFGNAQFTDRTRNNELFINPLMSMYFGFELDAVVRRSLYLHLLEGTKSIFDVGVIIEAFRESVEKRPRRSIPH
jgi:hypothetical protein